MANKTLKFRRELADLILAGHKNVTWRLFDDKSLAEGDVVDLLIWGTLEKFATAHLTEVREKRMGELVEPDFEGHEKFASTEEMYTTYSTYYGRPVDVDTPVKIIRFRLVLSSRREEQVREVNPV